MLKRLLLSISAVLAITLPPAASAADLDGHTLKERLLEACRDEAAELRGTSVYTPRTVAPWRAAYQSEQGNRESSLVDRVSDRILVFSELHAAGEEDCLDEAWAQIEVLFDDRHWPDWRDLAHQGDPAGLRTGDLGAALAVAWTLLEGDLSAERRAAFLDGLDRKVIQPFQASVDKGSWFLTSGMNWELRIVGGAGMVAAALGEEHPASEEIRAYAAEKMLAFPERLGSDGSFNESPGYVEDLDALVAWVAFCRPREPDPARRAAMDAAVARLAATARWNLWVTVAPGRLVAFGDTRPDRFGRSSYAAAVAQAAQDPVVQWLYAFHADRRLTDPDERVNPRELGWLDPDLAAADPATALPLAKAFEDQGAIVVSRSGWDLSPDSMDVVVAAKAGREWNHADHDAGTLTLDVGPHRVLRDLGKPSYPADYWRENRPRYYNDAPRGHNIVFFGDDDDPLGGMLPDGAGTVDAFEADADGARFRFDLSSAYAGDRSVNRKVLHQLPGVLAVLDTAELPGPERVRLRWHVPEDAALDIGPPDLPGVAATVRFDAGGTPVLGLLLPTPGGEAPSVTAGRHKYEAPFDTARTGVPLEQKREPYVQLSAEGVSTVSWLSVWLVGDAATAPLTHADGVLSGGTGASAFRLRTDGVGWLSN